MTFFLGDFPGSRNLTISIFSAASGGREKSVPKRDFTREITHFEGLGTHNFSAAENFQK